MKNFKNISLIILLISFFYMIQETAMGVPAEFSVTAGPSIIEFQIIDPVGNVTGYDSITRNVINNIPNTKYLLKSVYNVGDVPPNKNEIYHKIESTMSSDTTQMMIGRYKMKIFGSSMPENYLISIMIYYREIKPTIRYDSNSSIYPNVVWTYEFDVPITPPINNKLVLVKIANSQDLIIDLTVAGQLGYIGSSKFVSELTKEINEIEAEKAKGKVDDGLTPAQKAKKEYTELLKEITEKYNKPEADEFVKQEAYTVLKEDIEYIIGHIQ